MANLLVKNGAAADKYLKTSGAGTDLDPHISEHLESNSAAIKTAVETLDNAIAGNEMQVDVVTLPATASTVAEQQTQTTAIGGLTETAPATDTASSGLNGRLQRIAQRITSLIALIPGSLGQKTKANSFAVTLASDQDALPVTDNGGSLTIDNAALTSIDSKVPALGQALAAASVPVVLPAAQITTLTPPAAITGFATETTVAAIKTAVEALDNAVAGNELQVDVLTLPNVTIGAAIPAGNNNIGDVDIASIAAGDNNIGNVDIVTMPNVTIGSALPAGTNAIGKLAANSGVDIGDVDVTSLPALPAGTNNIGDVDVLTLPALPAGTNNIGDVDVLTLPALPAGNNNIGDVDIASIAAGETLIGLVSSSDTVVDLTATLDTSAYAGGDVLFDTQELASVARVNAGVVVLESLTVWDEDDQGVAMDIYFLDANNSLGTENSAPTISDANGRNILGYVSVGAADYKDLGGARVACVRGIGLQMKAGAGVTSLYVAGVTGGTPTHTASGLRFKFGFLR